ncbi:MAG: sigma-70 family RNA polymerase sigma factor [Bryobacterales bacterium]|nr:sigma-70 family RNA polymerase sigma factor [Bryobacterales bacterium]
MGPAPAHDITALLRAWSQGDQAALENLVPVVDRELHAIARRCLEARRHDPILETTSLIHEAYVRLIVGNQASWQDRVHFFAVCAKIMRRILVDHARARLSAKRGGGSPAISLNEALVVSAEPASHLVAIDLALEALAKVDRRKASVVELRFFGGLKIEETAEVLKVSPDTVRRDWRLAKAWLMRELSGA